MLGVDMPSAGAGGQDVRKYSGQGTGCEPAGNAGGVWGHQSQGMGSIFPMLRPSGPSG